MSRGKNIAVVLCLMAMAFFAGRPIWKWISYRAVSSSLQARTKTLVDSNPQLQLAWTVAMQDDVLTLPEAKVIVEAAGEKIEPEE